MSHQLHHEASPTSSRYSTVKYWFVHRLRQLLLRGREIFNQAGEHERRWTSRNRDDAKLDAHLLSNLVANFRNDEQGQPY